MFRINLPFVIAASLLLATGCMKSEDAGDRDETGRVEQGVEGEEEAQEETRSDESEQGEADPAGEDRLERWSIASGTYDCVGEAPQQCLRVQRGEEADWTLLYSDIEGFEQESGIAYQVRVRIVDVPNPPADGSSERYELVEVVSSSPAAAPQENPGGSSRDGAEEGAANDQAAAQACTTNADCAEGEMCAGPEGCDVEWTCVPQRACTRDLRMYCSCRGETVSGSGSCPPEPYAHRGPCENSE